VTMVRSLFAQAEKFAVPAASGLSVAMAASTRQLSTVVVAPGIAPLVSEVVSTPPAVTSYGLPEVAQPRKARMRPS
jgi:hypothetical protein